MKIAAVAIYDEFDGILHHQIVAVPDEKERTALIEMISNNELKCIQQLLKRIEQSESSQLHDVLLEEFDLKYSVIFIN